MPKLTELLKNNKMTLVVALPKNDPDLAQAAIAGGADALELKINIEGFGDFKAEKENLKNVLALSKVPVGIDLGYQQPIGQEELKIIKNLKFDFFNIRMKLVKPFMLKTSGLARVLSMNGDFSYDELINLSGQGADALDAAIISHTHYGQELKVGDLQNYISIVLSSGIPVVIPTQKDIRPSEVAIVADTGARGLLLTPVVTGTTQQHLERNVREFRIAVDDL